MPYGKIDISGFVSEYEYSEQENSEQGIFYPVTGHLVVLKDDPKALFLFDDSARIYHPITKVSFLSRLSNATEGMKVYPRPFVTEQTAAEKEIPGYKYGSKIISSGDKVKITYVNGSIYNPLVEGSIDAFGSFAQNKFLLTKSDEWEQVKTRLENDDYIFEYKDDAAGELTLAITAKKKEDSKKNKGGTGNITIDLIGTELNGKVTLNTTGIVTLNQKDTEGTVKQSLTLDNTKDNNIASIKQGEKQLIEMDETIGIQLKGATGAREFMANGDTLIAKFTTLIDNIESLVWMTNQGPTVGLNPASKQILENLKATLEKIQVK